MLDVQLAGVVQPDLSSGSMGHQLRENQESKILQRSLLQKMSMWQRQYVPKKQNISRGGHKRRNQISTKGGQLKCHSFGEVWKTKHIDVRYRLLLYYGTHKLV